MQWRRQSMQQCNVTERAHPKSINFALNLRRQWKKIQPTKSFTFSILLPHLNGSPQPKGWLCVSVLLTGH